MPTILIQRKIYLSQKKKEKLLCALARHPVVSAKKHYSRYNYMSISRPIQLFLLFYSQCGQYSEPPPAGGFETCRPMVYLVLSKAQVA